MAGDTIRVHNLLESSCEFVVGKIRGDDIMFSGLDGLQDMFKVGSQLLIHMGEAILHLTIGVNTHHNATSHGGISKVGRNSVEEKKSSSETGMRLEVETHISTRAGAGTDEIHPKEASSGHRCNKKYQPCPPWILGTTTGPKWSSRRSSTCSGCAEWPTSPNQRTSRMESQVVHTYRSYLYTYTHMRRAHTIQANAQPQ